MNKLVLKIIFYNFDNILGGTYLFFKFCFFITAIRVVLKKICCFLKVYY